MRTANSYRRGLVALLPILLVTACASMQVDSDRYPGADFSGYRTFAWMSGDPLIRPRGEEPQVSALNVRRIEEAIEIELAAKGYRNVDDPLAADFAVSFTVGARDRIDVESYPVPYRGPWLWRWPYYDREVDVRTYREGVLAVDIFEGKTRQPVWHGRARKQITGADVSDPAPVIKRAVTAILREFPSRKS